MIDAMRHNMLQHITEQLKTQKKLKINKLPNQATSSPVTGRKRKESDFHERNAGTKKPRGEENTDSIFSLL